MQPRTRPGLAATAGYSLIELIVAMGVFTVVMGATLGGLADVMKGNEVVMTVAALNSSARGGMDLIVRDLLQVGSGLPSSHSVSIPNGGGAVEVRIPGPPGADFYSAAGALVLPAVMPRAGAGPVINGVATDVLSVLMADNAFLDQALTAVGNSSVTVAPGPDLATGPDRVVEGQLMLIKKGSFNTLVQVTAVDVGARTLTFSDGDSLRLNQSGASNGNLPALNAEEPNGVDAAAATLISRMRWITYYIDGSDPQHPRLVRRVNNGHPLDFDNELGTAVALDTFDLQFTYDISNGDGNPGNVEMNASDLGVGGACAPSACAATQVRKVNVRLRSRSSDPNNTYLTNLLESQISLRAMAFVDRYR